MLLKLGNPREHAILAMAEALLRVVRKRFIRIECVMGTYMPRAKRSIQSEVTIDGFHLIWNLHREQLMPSGDDWTGMAIHVKVAEGVRRELYLEYPVYYKEQRGVKFVEPPRPTILAAKVEAHIRQAMAAGYDPGSRGKPFVHELDELPS
jgi:hypothetical protein